MQHRSEANSTSITPPRPTDGWRSAGDVARRPPDPRAAGTPPTRSGWSAPASGWPTSRSCGASTGPGACSKREAILAVLRAGRACGAFGRVAPVGAVGDAGGPMVSPPDPAADDRPQYERMLAGDLSLADEPRIVAEHQRAVALLDRS